MPIVMDPATVKTVTGADVSALAITVAADLIVDRTGMTPDENVTQRGLSESRVASAWAIISTRVNEQFSSNGVTPLSESETDYSYTLDRSDMLRARDLFAGLPTTLLGLSASSWSHRTTSQAVRTHPFWADVDQQHNAWLDSVDPTLWSGRYPVQ